MEWCCSCLDWDPDKIRSDGLPHRPGTAANHAGLQEVYDTWTYAKECLAESQSKASSA